MKYCASGTTTPQLSRRETTPTCGLTASTVQYEDLSSEALYIANGLITQGLGEDGLPPTGGFSLPRLRVRAEDNVKYYLKNEDENAGLYSSYLVANPNTTTVKCEEMTAAEAEADDNAAWYITFDPKTLLLLLQKRGDRQSI